MTYFSKVRLRSQAIFKGKYHKYKNGYGLHISASYEAIQESWPQLGKGKGVLFHRDYRRPQTPFRKLKSLAGKD